MSQSQFAYPPVVSICIPTINEGDFIYGCLEKLAAQQGFGSCEVIISDNPIADNHKTYDAIIKFVKNYNTNRIRYFKDVGKLGIGRARKFACEQAHPDSMILVNFDADSYFIYNNGLAKLCEPILSGQALWTGSYQIPKDERGIQDISTSEKLVNQLINTGVETGLSTFHECGFTVRKDAYNEVGGFPPDLKWFEGDYLDSMLLLHYGPALRKIVPEGATIGSARRNLGRHPSVEGQEKPAHLKLSQHFSSLDIKLKQHISNLL